MSFGFRRRQLCFLLFKLQTCLLKIDQIDFFGKVGIHNFFINQSLRVRDASRARASCFNRSLDEERSLVVCFSILY